MATLHGYGTCSPSFTTETAVTFSYITSAGTPTFTWSTAPSVGDLVIFTAAFYASGLTITHSGGTLDGFNFSSNSAGLTTAIGWRVYQSGDTAPVFSCGATAEQPTAFMLAYTPASGKLVTVDTTACNNTTAAGRTYTPPSVSAAGSGEISVIINLAFGTSTGPSAISQTLPTTPGSYTAYAGSSAYAGASSRHASFAGGGYLTGQGPGSIAPGSESVNPASANNTQTNVYQVLLKEANAITVTATQTVAPSNGIMLQVMVLTGAKPVASQTGGGGSAANATPNEVSVTTTQTGSRVYGASSSGASTTALASTTFITNFVDSPNTEWYTSWKAASVTGTPGAATYGSSSAASFQDIAALEILTTGTLAEDASAPAAASNTGGTTVTTASFAPPPGSLLVALIGSDGAAAGTATTMSVTGGGLTWTQAKSAASGNTCYAGVWIADVPSGGESGPFNITLPAPTTSLSGSAQHTESGSFNITLPTLAASLSGSAQHTESGTFNVTLLTLTASLSAKLIHEHGPFNIVLPVPTSTLSGSAQHTESGAFNITLPVLTSSLAAKLVHEHGPFNITLQTLTSILSGTAQHTESGSFNIVLPVPTASLAGAAAGGESGSFNITLPTLTSSLAAKVIEHGSFNITLPTLTASLSGTAQHTESGSFNIILPMLTSSLTGKAQHTESGPFNIALPTLTLSLTGKIIQEYGPFNITLPTLTTSLAGKPQHTEPGAFNVTLPVLTANLSGSTQHTESGPFNIVLPTLTASLSGSSLSTTVSGPFVLWLPPGVRPQEEGTFNVTFPLLVTNLLGAVQSTESGPFNIVLPGPRFTLAARYEAERGPFNITLSVLSTSLAGHTQQTIAGPLAIVLPTLSSQINTTLVHDGELLIWLGFGMELEGRFRDHALNFKFPSQESIRILEPVLTLQGTVQRPRLGPGDAHVSGYLQARKTRQGRRKQLKQARQQTGTIHKTGLEGADETYDDS